MRKIKITLCLLLFSFIAVSQEKESRKEVGISFYNLDQFGLSYKVGKEKALWRLNALYLSGGNNTIDDSNDNKSKNNNNQFGFSIGREYISPINSSLEFRCGFDLSYKHSKETKTNRQIPDLSEWTKDKSTESRYGFNLVLGVNYLLSDHVLFGIEVQPEIYHYNGTDKSDYIYSTSPEIYKNDISGFRYNITNSTALLTLSYRF